MKRFLCLLSTTLSCVALLGCGEDEFPTAPVTGQILCEGKPVPFAMIYFEPTTTGEEIIVGKPGFDVADAEGRFELSTYTEFGGDGAVIGEHRVRVDAPAPGRNPDGWSCPCMLDSNRDVKIVMVIDGDNEFTIELPKRKPGQQPFVPGEDEDEQEDEDE
ncbi:MAG: hypothetical protein AAGG48_17875 [Planctomycetota bacterium]